jgi:hypothetical protein
MVCEILIYYSFLIQLRESVPLGIVQPLPLFPAAERFAERFSRLIDLLEALVGSLSPIACGVLTIPTCLVDSARFPRSDAEVCKDTLIVRTKHPERPPSAWLGGSDLGGSLVSGTKAKSITEFCGIPSLAMGQLVYWDPILISATHPSLPCRKITRGIYNLRAGTISGDSSIYPDLYIQVATYYVYFKSTPSTLYNDQQRTTPLLPSLCGRPQGRR